MVRVLKENEALIQVGIMGLKQEDGTIMSVPLYRVVSQKDVQRPDEAMQQAGEIFANAYRAAHAAM